MPLLNPDCNAVADSRSGQENDSGVGTVLQLEESIVKWETSLPLDLNLESYLDNQVSRAENVMYRQAASPAPVRMNERQVMLIT